MLKLHMFNKSGARDKIVDIVGCSIVLGLALGILLPTRSNTDKNKIEGVATVSAELIEVEVSPIPQPKKQVKDFNKEQIKQDIINEFTELGDKAVDWALNTANCESKYNPEVISPNGLYHGLYQFLPSTFRANGGKEIYNYKDQIRVVKDMYKRNQQWQWPVCGK